MLTGHCVHGNTLNKGYHESDSAKPGSLNALMGLHRVQMQAKFSISKFNAIVNGTKEPK
jgi:hypothetical protein